MATKSFLQIKEEKNGETRNSLFQLEKKEEQEQQIVAITVNNYVPMF
jgi:hypothetical protein